MTVADGCGWSGGRRLLRRLGVGLVAEQLALERVDILEAEFRVDVIASMEAIDHDENARDDPFREPAVAALRGLVRAVEQKFE